MSELRDEIIAELLAIRADMRAGFADRRRQFDAIDARLDKLHDELDDLIEMAEKRVAAFQRIRWISSLNQFFHGGPGSAHDSVSAP